MRMMRSVNYLNKNSVKNYSENNFSDLMTVIDSMPQVSGTITHVIMHRGKCRYCCAFHKKITDLPQSWTPGLLWNIMYLQ